MDGHDEVVFSGVLKTASALRGFPIRRNRQNPETCCRLPKYTTFFVVLCLNFNIFWKYYESGPALGFYVESNKCVFPVMGLSAAFTVFRAIVDLLLHWISWSTRCQKA